jgi:Ca-activated chloride channel family protein
VEIGMAGDTTAIGSALATCVKRLKDLKGTSKVVILLTDGRNNAGSIDPETAAGMARTFGIKVYTIGVGSKGPVPYPVNDPMFGRRYVRVQIDLDSETLQKIADMTAGKSFLATDGSGLKLVYDEIDRMEPTTFKVKQYTVYNELAGFWLLLSTLTIVAGATLATTVFRRLP